MALQPVASHQTSGSSRKAPTYRNSSSHRTLDQEGESVIKGPSQLVGAAEGVRLAQKMQLGPCIHVGI